MEKGYPSVQMPELFVFLRAFLLGLVLAENFRIAYIGGSGLATFDFGFEPFLRLIVAISILGLLGWYASWRSIVTGAMRLIRSQRVDLLVSIFLGIGANFTLSSFTQKFHDGISNANPLWAIILVLFLMTIMLSSLSRALLVRRKKQAHQLYFLSDDEIQSSSHC